MTVEPVQGGRIASRGTLIALLVAAIVCGGIGTALLDSWGSAGSIWTAFAPLHLSASGNGLYLPFDPVWLVWRPRLGTALLALGAGTAGAALVALLTGRRRERTG